MRKTSQDAGDNTSITSGIENEAKKPGAGILKTTKNSIKRKVQHFSNESDDTANEPLLQKNKEKIEIEKQSAKFLISKTKTDFSSEKGEDKDKLLDDDKVTKPSISDVTGITIGAHMGNGFKEQTVNNSQSMSTASIHNHMNTNVFNNSVRADNSGITKTQILVELDASKSMGYSRSPLIFTTAKIHTDGKIQQMEPVQVTPVPISSTTEGGIVKIESKLLEKSNKTDNSVGTSSSVIKGTKDKPITSPIFQIASKLPKIHDNNVALSQNVSSCYSNETVTSDKTFHSGNKTKTEITIKPVSPNSYTIKNTVAQLPDISKTLKDKTSSTKTSQVLPDNKYKIENNAESSTLAKSLPITSEDPSNSIKLDKPKSGLSFQNTSSIGKNYIDINKNFQPQSPVGNKNTNQISDIANVKINVAGSSAKEGFKKSNLSLITTTKTEEKSSEKERIDLDSGFRAKKDLKKSNLNSIDMSKTRSETKKLLEKETTELDSGSNAKEGLEKSNLISKATTKTSSGTNIIIDAINPSTKEKPVDNNIMGEGLANNISTIKTTIESSSTPVISTRSTIDKALAAPSPKSVIKEASFVTKASSNSTMTSSATADASSATSTAQKNKKMTPKLSSTSAGQKITSTSMKSTYDSSKTTTADSTKTTLSDPKTTVEKFPKTEIESKKLTNTATSIASKCTLTGNSTSKMSTASSKNVATVVSSIPKPTASAPLKISNSKQCASPSVSTTPSAVQPSNGSQVPQNKPNLKTASNPVNKTISAVSNNTKPAKLSIAEKTSTTSTSSSAKTSSSLTAVAAKTHTTGKVESSETVKDSKGSKA